MSEHKHTPTPWHAEDDWIVANKRQPDRAKMVIYKGEDEYRLRDYWQDTDEARQANAEFIVRACNAHDDLIAALRLVEAYVDLQTSDPRNAKLARADLKTMRAALAKATGSGGDG